MKLLKIIVVIFLIYFIRRFVQMYRVMKQIQENQLKATQSASDLKRNPDSQNASVVDADFKVVD